MSPLSPEFAYFLAVLLPAYWLAPRSATVQNVILLTASIVAFWTWTPHLVGVLLASALVDFGIARGLDAQRPGPEAAGADAAARQRRMRALLAASVALNLGELLWFKYQGFFASSINAALGSAGLAMAIPVLRLVVPIGLSFRALQKLGCTIDVYHGRTAAPDSFLSYAAWVTFFPQLLAGPITRARAMLPQFAAARRPGAEQWASGAATFLLGFTLKAFVAERLGSHLVDPVFASPGSFDALSHWAALLGYAGQVFADFCGYSVMAIGAGRVLGLELPENFNYPFISRSLPEFWRRWHITLNAWLFDYIFVPLTTGQGWFRNRFGPAFLLVFLVSGLWHGAQWTFVFWGLLHGAGLVVHERWDNWYKARCRADRRWVGWRKSVPYSLASWMLTQSFFVLTLVLFRAASVGDARRFMSGLAGAGSGRGVSIGLQVMLAVLFLFAYHVPALRPGGRVLGWFLDLPPLLRGAAYGLAIVLILLLAPVGGGTFIYAQF